MAKKKSQTAKRIRSFTGKINIEYLLSKMAQDKGYKSANEVTAFINAHKKQYTDIVFNNFKEFCHDDSNKVYKACIKLHDKDTHVDKKTKKRVATTWHFHFIVISKVLATESAWRKRLFKHGIFFTDEERIKKQREAGVLENKIKKDFDPMPLDHFAHSFAYLFHRTVKSIKAGKYAYSQDKDNNYFWTMGMTDDEIRKLFKDAVENTKQINYIQFGDVENKKKDSEYEQDDNEILSYYQEIYEKFGKNQADELDAQLTASANMYADKISQGMTVREVKDRSRKIFGKYFAKFWRMYHVSFENERNEYIKALMQQLPYRDRKFSLFYISGDGGTGKSRVSNQLAFLLSDKKTHAVHTVSPNGKRKTFDLVGNYDNELVSVAHELAPSAIGVDEFENVAEPHRFPEVNSRNKDKAYLAQSLIITKAMTLAQWAYTLLYTDYIAYGRHADRYGYKTEIEIDENQTEKLYFPRTYADFYDAFKDEDSKYWEHWTFHGATLFFIDMWQILRRLQYNIDIEPLDKEHEVDLHVRKLSETKKMKHVECFDDFEFDMNFDNFFDDVGIYYIDDYLQTQHVQVQLRKMLVELEQRGLIVNSTLPKLLSDEELDKLMCVDDENNINLYTDIRKETKQKSLENVRNIKQNDDTMSDEEFNNFVKENYGF